MLRLSALVVLVIATVLAVACDDEEEAPSTSATSASATSTLSGTPSAAVTPSWSKFSDPNGAYAIEYPNGWYIRTLATPPQIRIASFNLDTWNGDFPSDGVMIDVGRYAPDKTPPRPTGASDATLGGELAWMIQEGPAGGGDATWKSRQIIGTVHRGYGYTLFIAFGSSSPDEGLSSRVLNNFRFVD